MGLYITHKEMEILNTSFPHNKIKNVHTEATEKKINEFGNF